MQLLIYRQFIASRRPKIANRLRELVTRPVATSSEWILESSKGTALEPGNIRRSIAGMVRGTKFEGMKPYDLRHTFAQRLLDEGVDVKTAAEMMRHSVEVFLARYVRSDRARKMEAIKRLRKGKAAA
jgi:site-specific recombinase XerD